MKKLFAILLCIVMMLSMVACGGNQDNNETPNNDQGNAVTPNGNEQLKGEPTDEEKNLIGLYSEAVSALEEYVQTGYLSIDCQKFGIEYEGDIYILEGAAAAEKYYEVIKSLDIVDKWVGSDYLAEFTSTNWNRQSVLNSFVIYENMKLSENYTIYDPVGNTKNLTMNWYYDNNGKLTEVRWDSEIGERYQYSFVFDPVEVDPLHLMMWEDDYRAEPVYGADGKVTEVKIIGGGETMYLGKLTYGSNGEVSTATVTNAYGDKGTLNYSYNDQNQVVEISFTGEGLQGSTYYTNTYWEGYGEKTHYVCDSFTYTYTYNSDGTVATKTFLGYSQWNSGATDSVVTEYTYDAAGNLSGAVCTRNYNMQSTNSDERALFTDTYTFTCDAQGTPVFATITSSDIAHGDSNTEPTETPKIEVECVYGNLYVYNPAK